MNNQPNYILKLNETAFVPINNNSTIAKLKPIILGILLVLVIGSFIFGDNLFSELSLLSKVLLLGLIIAVARVKTTERQPSTLEIHFYDDRLILYRDKIIRTRKVTQREYFTIKYENISECVKRTTAEKICFHCTYDGLCYRYNSDGTLNQTPHFNKTVNNGLVFFYYDFERNRDFVSEIEAHSPLKIKIEDT